MVTRVTPIFLSSAVSNDTEHEFNANMIDWGFNLFMSLNEIHDFSQSYLVNDICIVEAIVSVRKVDIKILDQESGDLLDFKGLGKIELAFHPCTARGSLFVASSVNRVPTEEKSYICRMCIHNIRPTPSFLEDYRVKDLNQDGCDRLQLLWEELETFKFDLAWLQPHVQSVFGMKNMAGRMDRMREDVNILENEIKWRGSRLAAPDVDLERAKEDLVKAEQGFYKIGDADSVIVYLLP